MKKTPLLERHQSLQARMVHFAGYQMPLEFTGVKDEHLTVRRAAGLFDVSHMGEIWVKGPAAPAFMQKVTSNDIQLLYPGRVQYTCLTNQEGGIIDDVLVYMYDDQKYFLVVNAANIHKDWTWLNHNNTERAALENASDRISQLALQGPHAADVLQKICSAGLPDMKNYSFRVDKVASVDQVIISKTGYTGAGGFELYCYNPDAAGIWDALMEAGKAFGIKPAGLGARDTLRLEMGFCLYGNDINEHTTPIEAGLDFIVKFNEDNPFIGREKLEIQQREGVSRKLVGFTMLEKGIPRQHYEILEAGGKHIGEVTSGTLSPSLNTGIGMGYVNSGFAPPGGEVLVKIRNKQLRAAITKLPFYRKDPK